MARSTSINLLRSHENHFWEHFLKWALTTGRFLIILTETIALAAFVYRFSLDREIIDLGDTIKQNQTIVSFYKEQEARYRNLQERLAFAEELATPTDPKTDLLTKFVTLARGKMVFQNISLSNDSVMLEATTSSPGALSAFLAAMKTLHEVKSVTVDRVENKASTGLISVTITATLIGTPEEGEQDADR